MMLFSSRNIPNAPRSPHALRSVWMTASGRASAATARLSDTWQKTHPWGRRSCETCSARTGAVRGSSNLQASALSALDTQASALSVLDTHEKNALPLSRH
jgi:hypothetical protein